MLTDLWQKQFAFFPRFIFFCGRVLVLVCALAFLLLIFHFIQFHWPIHAVRLMRVNANSEFLADKGSAIMIRQLWFLQNTDEMTVIYKRCLSEWLCQVINTQRMLRGKPLWYTGNRLWKEKVESKLWAQLITVVFWEILQHSPINHPPHSSHRHWSRSNEIFRMKSISSNPIIFAANCYSRTHTHIHPHTSPPSPHIPGFSDWNNPSRTFRFRGRSQFILPLIFPSICDWETMLKRKESGKFMRICVKRKPTWKHCDQTWFLRFYGIPNSIKRDIVVIREADATTRAHSWLLLQIDVCMVGIVL